MKVVYKMVKLLLRRSDNNVIPLQYPFQAWVSEGTTAAYSPTTVPRLGFFVMPILLTPGLVEHAYIAIKSDVCNCYIGILKRLQVACRNSGSVSEY